jgi:hypothetical protein
MKQSIASILAEAPKTTPDFTGTPLRENAIAEGELKVWERQSANAVQTLTGFVLQHSKGKGQGWYLRLDRIVVDEKGQILLPWMTPIQSQNGQQVHKQLTKVGLAY